MAATSGNDWSGCHGARTIALSSSRILKDALHGVSRIRSGDSLRCTDGCAHLDCVSSLRCECRDELELIVEHAGLSGVEDLDSNVDVSIDERIVARWRIEEST